MAQAFPSDIASPVAPEPPRPRAWGTPNVRGRYADEWGCVFEVMEDGVVGEVKDPILADRSAAAAFQPPRELLDLDWSRVTRSPARPEAFVLAGSGVRPFERLQFLRGTENLYVDMALEAEEYHRLKAAVHGFYRELLERWAGTDVDGIAFMDDWGAQHALLISPETWRRDFKPLYREYCAVIHGAGKLAFFHSDGNIEAIIGDLVEIGVDALNSELFCMDIEAIGSRYAGRICFWGEMDRQRILPFGTPEDVRSAVARARRALETPAGGVIAQCEWGTRDPYANVEAVYRSWDEPAAGLSSRPTSPARG